LSPHHKNNGPSSQISHFLLQGFLANPKAHAAVMVFNLLPFSSHSDGVQGIISQ
jgi:hypothetical protein